MYWCPKCKERWFDTKLNGDLECKDCAKEKNDQDIGVSQLSAANNMDQWISGYPVHLPVLTEIEEMLITCVHVVMKSFFI